MKTAESLRLVANVVLVGAVGVGKSSIINLLAQSDLAPTSSSAAPCTSECKAYEIAIPPTDPTQKPTHKICLWDTPGLTSEVPQPDQHHFQHLLDLRLKEGWVEKPVDLIVFCIRSGIRDLISTRANWEIVRSIILGSNIPVLIVVTGLETEKPDMESWWRKSEKQFNMQGIELSPHCKELCITTLKEDLHTQRYRQSYSSLWATILSMSKLPKSQKAKVIPPKRIRSYLKAYHQGGFEAAGVVLNWTPPSGWSCGSLKTTES